jgi:hypothetical protein
MMVYYRTVVWLELYFSTQNGASPSFDSPMAQSKSKSWDFAGLQKLFSRLILRYLTKL